MCQTSSLPEPVVGQWIFKEAVPSQRKPHTDTNSRHPLRKMLNYVFTLVFGTDYTYKIDRCANEGHFEALVGQQCVFRSRIAVHSLYAIS